MWPYPFHNKVFPAVYNKVKERRSSYKQLSLYLVGTNIHVFAWDGISLPLLPSSTSYVWYGISYCHVPNGIGAFYFHNTCYAIATYHAIRASTQERVLWIDNKTDVMNMFRLLSLINNSACNDFVTFAIQCCSRCIFWRMQNVFEELVRDWCRVSSHEPSQNSLTFPWHFPDHFLVFPDHETYYRHFITALTLILQAIWQITHQK